MSKLIKEIMDAINAVSKNKTEPYDRQGEVKRIEGKIAWVKLEGSDRETPIQMTIACDVGDTVQARIGGGSAWLTGNLTAPPTDDKKANQAITMVTNIAETVQETVDEALEDVSSVEDVTVQYCLSDSSSTFTQYGDWSNTPPTYVSGKYYWTRTVLYDEDGNPTYGTPQYSQDTQLSVETSRAYATTDAHFWYDSTGAYVTNATKIDYKASASNKYATRVTPTGILQSYSGNLLSTWTNSGIGFYAGDGTTADNSTKLAQFGSGGVDLYSGGSKVASFAQTGGWGSMTIYSSGVYAADFSPNSISFYKSNVATGLLSADVLMLGDTTNSVTIAKSGQGLQGVTILAPEGVSVNGAYKASGYKLLTIGTVTGDATTISASSTTATYFNIASQAPTGYTPIGIIGMSRTGTSSTYVNIYNWYLSGTTIYWAGRNLHTSDATVTPTFYVLYIATTQGV